MSKEKLMIFVKNEEAGKVKTRLAKSVGDEKALDIYRTLLRYTHTQVAPLDVHKEVWYSRFIEKNDIWSKGEFNKKVQAGEDLGKRISDAFKKTLEGEGFDKAVIIGSDCGELTTDILQQAFNSLEDHDMVIGPANDGGYYLLGIRKFIRELFTDICWGTGSVLEQTLEKADKENVTYCKLQELNDVDVEADWKLVKDKFESE